MAIPGRESTATTQQAPNASAVPTANKFEKLKDKLKPVKDSVANKYYKVLLWGKTKTGKTTLAADFPKPLILVDVREKGTVSIQDVDGIQVYELESWEELEVIYQYLAYGDHGFKTIVIDTITQLQDISLEKVLANRGAASTASKTQKDWGDAITLMKVWLQHIKDLPMNVVLIAQYRENSQQDVTTARQAVPNVGAALSPSLAGFVESIVDINGWVHIDEVPVYNELTHKTTSEIKHCLVVKPDGIYSVGIRLPGKDCACPTRIVDPDYEKLKAIISPAVKKE
jgi:hypothetical protein